MGRKIAVAVIHGVGSQADKKPPVSGELSFSARLHAKLRRQLGRRTMRDKVAWREIFWADILQERQRVYLDAISDQVRIGKARHLLVENFADALAFSRQGQAYDELNDRIATTVTHLRRDCEEDSPLVIIAHSFGGRIMSNYMWDLQQKRFGFQTPFENLQTTARFITFGCNLPLFVFSFPPEEVEPIAFPGTALPPELVAEPWWTNYFDRQDLLAYPIAPIGPKYRALEANGELADIPVNVGGLFKSWNVLSHDEYWHSPEFYKPVAAILKRLIAA